MQLTSCSLSLSDSFKLKKWRAEWQKHTADRIHFVWLDWSIDCVVQRIRRSFSHLRGLHSLNIVQANWLAAHNDDLYTHQMSGYNNFSWKYNLRNWVNPKLSGQTLIASQNSIQSTDCFVPKIFRRKMVKLRWHFVYFSRELAEYSLTTKSWI